ncbi:MAG: SpoIIIAC/SpoIIIAD family protein [Candidatus Limivicinus sp.]|nr:SpoIIIAC/SpoIIIAD family protein [Candidatus Limivicinus sp.]
MELILKAAALALTAALIGIVLRRTNPEMTLLLSICTVVLIMGAALGFAKSFTELAQTVQRIFGVSETLIKPVIKCVAVAIITKLTSDLCKDSSQAAAASAVELAGTVCALCIIMPLLMSMLTAIGGMI